MKFSTVQHQTILSIRTLPPLGEALIVSVSTAPGQREMQATLCFFSSVPISAAIRSHYKFPIEHNSSACRSRTLTADFPTP
jgi:hypothetical protein